MTIAVAGGAARNAGPYLHGPEIDAVAEVLRSGHFGHGPASDQFENALAAYLGVPDVVSVASGTAALHLGLLAAGVGPGDEVIVPSMTFCASVQAIVAVGARPRFIEVDPHSLCVTSEAVAEALTPATRAVMPVLYGGRAVPLTAIQDTLETRGVLVIEDAAQTFGSRTDDRLVGATGVMTCMSFGPTKNLTCGEGGAIVPRSPQEAANARRLRTVGIAQTLAQRASSTSYRVDGFGLRAHLPSINAAIGVVQLANFAEAAKRRQLLWRTYAEVLHDHPGVELVDVDIANTVPFNCVVQVSDRDRVFHRMREAGIGVGVHYPPNHLQPAFAPRRISLPVTETIGHRIISLPFHPSLSTDDIDQVVTALHDALTT